MVTLVDVVGQVEKIDIEIISLILERARLCQQSGGLDADQETELFSVWLEEAAESGLDEEKMDKIGRLIIGISRQSLDDE